MVCILCVSVLGTASAVFFFHELGKFLRVLTELLCGYVGVDLECGGYVCVAEKMLR